jgi:hypothetical protein
MVVAIPHWAHRQDCPSVEFTKQTKLSMSASDYSLHNIYMHIYRVTQEPLDSGGNMLYMERQGTFAPL